VLKIYYLKAAVLPSIIVSACNVIYGVIYAAFCPYKSDYLTADGVVRVALLMEFINSAIIMVLSLPIFLNYYPQVKNKLILSVLAWLLCPMIWLGILIINSRSDLFDYSEGIYSPGIPVLINTIPYVIPTVWYFIRFRKDLKISIVELPTK
jgi:hypothetical protein